MDFFFQNNSVENSLICPRAKSSNHCLTELFSIYQNKHWTIRRRDDHIVVPSSNRIKSKIDWIFVYSSLEYGFCNKSLRYKWSSDQLNTFSSLFGGSVQFSAALAKKWLEFHLYQSNFLQNLYFKSWSSLMQEDQFWL